MICPEKQGDKLSRQFHNQYMNSEGKWTTDYDHKATCRQDKVEILEYCKKVNKQLTNSRRMELATKKCKTFRSTLTKTSTILWNPTTTRKLVVGANWEEPSAKDLHDGLNLTDASVRPQCD